MAYPRVVAWGPKKGIFPQTNGRLREKKLRYWGARGGTRNGESLFLPQGNSPQKGKVENVQNFLINSSFSVELPQRKVKLQCKPPCWDFSEEQQSFTDQRRRWALESGKVLYSDCRPTLSGLWNKIAKATQECALFFKPVYFWKALDQLAFSYNSWKLFQVVCIPTMVWNTSEN